MYNKTIQHFGYQDRVKQEPEFAEYIRFEATRQTLLQDLDNIELESILKDDKKFEFGDRFKFQDQAETIAKYISIEAKKQSLLPDEPSFVDLETYLKEQFPDWVIVHLNYPLRTTKILSEMVKMSANNDDTHSNQLNSSLQIASNMPLGPVPIILPGSKGSYQERLQHAFSMFGSSKAALIILKYDLTGMKPTQEEIQDAKKSTLYKELTKNITTLDENDINGIVVGIEAVRACNRPHDPLFGLIQTLPPSVMIKTV